MRLTLSLVAAGVLAIFAWASVSPAAAPQPSEVPTAWELDFQFQAPKAVTLALPGHEARTYWYLVYRVINRSDQDVIYVPNFVLYTDTGQISPAGQGVPVSAFEAIKKLTNDPLLLDVTNITGKLLQGEDNARVGVAIWQDFDPKAGEIDVFIGGLSGETATVPLPVPVEVEQTTPAGKTEKVTKTSVVLSKTLRVRYAVPGEAAGRTRTAVKQLDKEWVMR